MARLYATAHVLQMNEDAAAPGSVRGTRWHVRVIDAGLAKSGVTYPLATLHEAVPIFDGLPCIVRSDEKHVKGEDTDANLTEGWLSDTRAVPEGIDGILNLLESSPTRAKLVEAWDRGKKDLLGLSIVAEGRARVERDGNGTRTVAKAITKGYSVDVVVHPAAGGRLLDMVAAEGGSPGGVHMFERMRKFLEAEHPDLYKPIQARLDAGETVTEDDLFKVMQEGTTALREADTQKPGGDAAKPAKTNSAGSEGSPAASLDTGVMTKLTEAVGEMRAFMEAHKKDDTKAATATAVREAQKFERFVEARLANVHPEIATFVREDMPLDCTEAEFDAILEKQVSRDARLRGFRSPVNTPTDDKGRRAARVTLTEGAKIRHAMDGFFAESDQKDANGNAVPRFTSLRQMYGELTGDTDVVGDFAEADRLQSNVAGMADPELWEKYDPRLFSEAVTTSAWAQVYADTLRRALVREYKENDQQHWKLLADVVSTPDFRPRHAIRMGGYGKLGLITEDLVYPSFTSPGDDESTYSPLKYGGTDYLTREAILNDDVGAARRMPRGMAMSAAYTLNWFVTTTLFASNPAMTGTDTAALFHASHNNTDTVALADASLQAARRRLMQQTIGATDVDANWDSATTRRLGLMPKYLWVPSELDATAFALTVAQNAGMVEGTPSFLRSLGLTSVVVPHWDDATNWFLTADKAQGPLIELAFVQGKENPDIFIQDAPTAGEMFTRDRTTFKLRHEYGGTTTDFRLADGSIVAG